MNFMVRTSLGIRYSLLVLLLVGGLWSFHTLLVKSSSSGCSNHADSFSAVITYVVGSDYILITNLMHWLLFNHKILFSSTCFEPQVLIFRRILLYTCSIMVLSLSMRVSGGLSVNSLSENWLKTPTNNLPPPVNSHSSCVLTGHQELS